MWMKRKDKALRSRLLITSRLTSEEYPDPVVTPAQASSPDFLAAIRALALAGALEASAQLETKEDWRSAPRAKGSLMEGGEREGDERGESEGKGVADGGTSEGRGRVYHI